MVEHEIRLIGPWDSTKDGGASWNRCVVPLDVASLDLHPEQCVWLRRKFNQPSGLTATADLRLTISASYPPQVVLLNDSPIEIVSRIAGDDQILILTTVGILPVLKPHNQLVLRWQAGEVPVLEQARLQILTPDPA